MSGAQILVVDDESDIRGLLKEILSEEGYSVDVAADATQARELSARSRPDLVLLDIWMPDTDGITLLREWAKNDRLEFPVVMMSGHGTVETAVEATRLGAFDFIEKPLSLAKLLHTVERALDEGRPRTPPGRRLVPAMMAPVGKSRVMQDLREQVQKIAAHDMAVLITGEHGTGRETFARYLHGLSRRANGPFVTLVAGTLTERNAEEQLHGAERDGQIHPGHLERAAGGTLFINEVEDLHPVAQRLLVSDLERGSLLRHGGATPLPLDLRLVASAQPGVENRETLRRDLLSHMNDVPLRIPPLREYPEDVPELLRYYVDKLVDTEGLRYRRFSVAAQNRLRNYPWPGNIRDLKALVRRLLVASGEEEISLEEIERELSRETPADEPLVKQDLLSLPLREAREAFERAYLQQQLILCDGKVGALAKRVGMERTHLYRKLRALGVDFGQSGDSDD